MTVFEAKDRIGGLWPISKEDDGMVNPEMCTNQSRHTVAFSDLAWEEKVSEFPKAWEVGAYLERYVGVYGGYEIKLDCRVTKAELKGERWVVQMKRSSGEEETGEFDHLIVATGFFGEPNVPKVLEGFQAPVWHSSKVRDVKDLLTDGEKVSLGKRRNIVVVGGQMSGVEIAAAVALQLSSAEASPGENNLPDASKYYITHVVQNPVWVMTLFFPKNPVVDVTGPDGKATKVSTVYSNVSDHLLNIIPGVQSITILSTRRSSNIQPRVAARRTNSKYVRLHFPRSSKSQPRFHEHLSRHRPKRIWKP